MRRILTLAIVTVALAQGVAWAQFGPGGGGAGGGGMRPMGQTPGQGMEPGKEDEGPAEAAPDQQGQEPATQPLPAWPGQREKALQFFQVDGYLRGRTYLFHNFNMGYGYSTTSGAYPPFYVPYSEVNATGDPKIQGGGNTSSCAARNQTQCATDNLTSADMRLRIEPTINVSEQVRVKAQIDIFDNMVMGSTPEGYYINGQPSQNSTPLPAFSRSQASPQGGSNSFSDSINVKRAWAEVRTPIGELRFGRMPSSWGTGMFINDGACPDCDYGNNADRIMFVTKEPWHDHFFALLWDWVATGPTTAVFNPNQQGGQAYNADPITNVSQWGLAVGKQDKPDELKEKLEKGKLVLNYGLYAIYRQQDWDLSSNPGGASGVGTGVTPERLQTQLVPRGAKAGIGDLWFRLNWHKLHIEAEAVIIDGKITSVTDQLSTGRSGYNIFQYGGVAKADVRLLHDALHLGFEVGFASGDAYEDSTAPGTVNFERTKIVYPDGATIGRFTFDPDYHVDLILFRRILGTVYNATYFKGSIAYDLAENFSARADVIYSLANVAVATPGNSNNLGLEIDASLMYHNDEEGFSAGLAYGVLFPFAALNEQPVIFNTSKTAEASQTVQARVVVKF